MQHLIFRLHGVWCSWGDIALGTHRPSRGMPTRSAVLGLVASALGYDRKDEVKHAALGQSLGMAFRLEALGASTTDYHTVQMPSRERGASWKTRREELAPGRVINTLLSAREHMQDAAYTACVWSRAAGGPSLIAMGDALDRPRYPLFLGRRACPPSLPLFAHVVEADSLRSAFDSAQFPDEDAQALAKLGRGPMIDVPVTRDRRVEFDEHPAPGYANAIEQPQRDDVANRSRRTFRDRHVQIAVHSRPEGE